MNGGTWGRRVLTWGADVKHLLLILSCVLALGGCATSPIPEGYSGPIANVQDTAHSETPNRAVFFYVAAIDGQRIENILSATRRANSGRGFSLSPVQFAREIPARPAKLTLEGRVAYGAPIQEIMNSATVYTIEKSITLVPESNKAYVVKGTLTADRKEVWLEEATSGKRIE